MNPNLQFLPTLNASLNGTCALLLLVGYGLIQKGRIKAHSIFMRLAFVTSILFLIGYLSYHAYHGTTRFPGTGWSRPLYFLLLISHTLCAALTIPLVLRTLYLATHDRFREHKQIAQWTFPVWLYVSVTGVVVYWMLYRMEWK